MSTFCPGQRVRCINGKFDSFVREFVDEVPLYGGVYTIREICFEASGWEAGNVAPGFFFEEIPEGLPGLDGRICWEAIRFLPVEDADEARKRGKKAAARSSRRAAVA